MMLIRPRWIELLKNNEGTWEPETTPSPVGSSPLSSFPTDQKSGQVVRPASDVARSALADLDAAIRALTEV
jgi:hypothetical protein